MGLNDRGTGRVECLEKAGSSSKINGVGTPLPRPPKMREKNWVPDKDEDQFIY